jgi:nitronate monooxygenase
MDYALMVLDRIELPIVLAPLAGGPATVDLAVAVSDAGGLGFLAAGYRTTAEVREQIAEVRARTGRPFGVNVFAPPGAPSDPAGYAAYLERLGAEAERAGVALGEPRSDDDAWEEKVALLTEVAPPVVSFVFGCPGAELITELRARGTEVWVTVTTPEEARAAERAGADALIAQGLEAGGHRGAHAENGGEAFGLVALLQLLAAGTRLPLVAAGGIATGRGLAAALAAGARAAQIGTAFLRCPEAGTTDVHRTALAGTAPTAVTRAFTGKPARGIVNRFMREHSDVAPAAFPEIHHVTAPLRAAGRKAGDQDVVNLWAGQAYALAEEAPAAGIVQRLVAEARAALGEASTLL